MGIRAGYLICEYWKSLSFLKGLEQLADISDYSISNSLCLSVSTWHGISGNLARDNHVDHKLVGFTALSIDVANIK